MNRPEDSAASRAPTPVSLRTYKLPVGPMGANCYLAWDELDGQAVVIDPGDEPERIIEAAAGRGLQVRYILNTHGHGDHIGANSRVRDKFDVPLLIHEADAPMLTDPWLNMSAAFGVSILSPPAEGFLVPGRSVRFGTVELEVLHTPGHTPGGVSFRGPGVVFTGDTLFCGSVGRCDLPGGDQAMQLKAIHENLLTLPMETVVHPGHGPSTTIGQEMECNPYLS
ncbi:MAG: MBL fold metallo-hydrolase [Gemmatimonadota bacterium]|nr:MBL fold metallo-hydrolase [Gemmatimonadota bacterium]